jgi:hypothetical protein
LREDAFRDGLAGSRILCWGGLAGGTGLGCILAFATVLGLLLGNFISPMTLLPPFAILGCWRRWSADAGES